MRLDLAAGNTVAARCYTVYGNCQHAVNNSDPCLDVPVEAWARLIRPGHKSLQLNVVTADQLSGHKWSGPT